MMRLAISCPSPVSSRPHDMHRAVKRAVHNETMTAWHASTVLVSHPFSRLYGTHVRTRVVARGLGGPGADQRKKIKREDEPEEYWMSESEREGKNPFKDPLAIIGIAAIFLPFVLLGIAIALGLVDVNGGR